MVPHLAMFITVSISLIACFYALSSMRAFWTHFLGFNLTSGTRLILIIVINKFLCRILVSANLVKDKNQPQFKKDWIINKSIHQQKRTCCGIGCLKFSWFLWLFSTRTCTYICSRLIVGSPMQVILQSCSCPQIGTHWYMQFDLFLVFVIKNVPNYKMSPSPTFEEKKSWFWFHCILLIAIFLQ